MLSKALQILKVISLYMINSENYELITFCTI